MRSSAVCSPSFLLRADWLTAAFSAAVIAAHLALAASRSAFNCADCAGVSGFMFISLIRLVSSASAHVENKATQLATPTENNLLMMVLLLSKASNGWSHASKNHKPFDQSRKPAF